MSSAMLRAAGVPDRLPCSAYFNFVEWMNERRLQCSAFKYFRGLMLPTDGVAILAKHYQISATCLNFAAVRDRFKVVATLLGLLTSACCSLEKLNVSIAGGAQQWELRR